MSGKNIGEILVRKNFINIHQLEQALKEQKAMGGRLGETLIKLGYVNEEKLIEFMSEQYSVPSINLSNFEVDPEVIKLVPRNFCEKHTLIPISKASNTLVVAMADPSNLAARDDLAFLTHCKIEIVLSMESQIISSIERYYQSEVRYEEILTEMEKDSFSGGSSENMESIDIEKTASSAPIIKFVNLMLSEAIKLKASDIHIEPYEKRFRIRFRVDGQLYEKIQPNPGISNAVTSRLKVMSKLDIAERRRPQDGRLKIALKGGQEIDFRVSVLPTLFGEKIVMRLLDKTNLQLDMTRLGFTQEQLDAFQDGIHQSYGMVLITGPTGSGKTTTIYSALAELNKSNVNLSTAEDPVEFNLEGINQVQMNPEIDLNFASALRSFLRQDPDILMVGEIRDLETAEVAFKAALTGHLVVSTLHTNDAPSTVNRLLNMGIEPFLVTSTINLIVAQRLVRKICSSCKTPTSVEPEVLIDLGIPKEEIGTFQVMKGEGCGQCNGMGFKGRMAIYEVMTITDRLKKLIFQKVSPMELKQGSIESGMKTLRMSALQKLKEGTITISEVLNSSVKDSK